MAENEKKRDPKEAAQAAMRHRDMVMDDIVLPFSMQKNAPQPLQVEPAYTEQDEEDFEDE